MACCNNTCNNSCRQSLCNALFGTGCCNKTCCASANVCPDPREAVKAAFEDVGMKTHTNTCLQAALSQSNNCCCCCCCCCMPPAPPCPPMITRARLTGMALQPIADGAAVVFDSTTDLGSGITYSNGMFTILEPGNYDISWWVTTSGTTPAVSTFVLERSNGAGIPGSGSTASGVIRGSAMLNVNSVPETIRLVNRSGAPVTLSGRAVQAEIQICRVG